MQAHAAVYRTQDSLAEGCVKVDAAVDAFADIGTSDRSLIWNTDLIETLELRNLLAQAACTVHAAEGVRAIDIPAGSRMCPVAMASAVGEAKRSRARLRARDLKRAK